MSEPSPHLLIVDDDERIRGLLRKFLIRHGFLVSVARDAAHARRVLAGLDFDLIVMDVMMPGESGIETVKLFRFMEFGDDRYIPIIALTAHAGEDDRRRFLRAGMDGRITKPIKIGDFLQTIEKILGDRVRHS